MQRISTNNLRPGLVVGKDILNADGDVLLRWGIVLTDKYIRRLIELDIYSVYVESPYLENIVIPEPINERIRVKAIKILKDNFLKIRVNKTLDVEAFSVIANAVVDEVCANRNLLIHLTDIRVYDDYTFGHSVNVAILATFAGIGVGYGKTKLRELALGGLLHDVGKMFVPKEILNKPAKLTEDEMKVMKGHSLFGFELLRNNPEISLLVAHMAFQHHERPNGSGYPRGLQGEEIHEYANIIAIADVYDALTSDRPYRRGILPHEAYEVLLELTRTQVDIDLLKIFFKYIAIYPIGSIVQLNTGEVGVVVNVQPQSPLRPKIRIVLDNYGKAVKKVYEIDLEINLTQFIIKVFKEEDRIVFPLNIHGI
jgi:HD-GYP domain-containing protein (c-di-GMP phosphodiesterase class II)